MVGIVIVSHSAKLADGIKELAEQMVSGPAPIAVAGGFDDPENPIGTDATKIHEAIESVYDDDGVVVLMDLGSALMSAEIALEILSPARRSKVLLTAAPLVEGAVAAVVRASTGGTRAQVAFEAQSALAPKIEHLSAADETGSPSAATPNSLKLEGPVREWHFVMPNALGLHARPAAQLVHTVNHFDAEVRLTTGDKSANAKSINQVITLGARQGDEIAVAATGVDANRVLQALRALAADNFGETDDGDLRLPSRTGGTIAAPLAAWSGIAASPGVAVAPVAILQTRLPAITADKIDDPAAEILRLETAVRQTSLELERLGQHAVPHLGESDAAIFDAQVLIVQDPELHDRVRGIIQQERISAEAAWDQVIRETAATYDALADDILRERAADVRDTGHRVLSHLMGLELSNVDLHQPSILIANDLTPSDIARLDPKLVEGICTVLGGATTHSAILARAAGIPAVFGVGEILRSIPAGQIVAIDGDEGVVWPNPNAKTMRQFENRRTSRLKSQDKGKASALDAAVTRDGHKIEIDANIVSPQDVLQALEYGAEGVGLFRTEFLFMNRQAPPPEEEQFRAYRRAAELLGGRRLTIRTLDAGGDKSLPYLALEPEANPFLGYRGLRYWLDHPEISQPQLRAILRVATEYSIRLMFPMVSTIGELRRARALISAAQLEIEESGHPAGRPIQVGAMIEVPAAVTVVDQLAGEVDFLSIGTNDLTQYIMAADRSNRYVAHLAKSLQPAVLRAIHQVSQAATAAGIQLSVCGELAGNSLAIPALVGLGVPELSMSALAIPAVKEIIRQLTLSEAREFAGVLLESDSVEAVEAHLSRLKKLL